MNKKIITVFGSSRPTDDEAEYKLAFELGSLLARSDYTVCNGGYGGTMEASARGAKESGGKTIGVLTDFFSPVANQYIGETIHTTTLIERTTKLIDIADGYVILKGSTGTLLEFSAVWEFMNKRVIKRRPVMVIGDFWKPVIDTLDQELAFEQKTGATQYVTLSADPSDCVQKLTHLLNSPLKL
jgi:uncharacterized protein (TIGR00725 family)